MDPATSFCVSLSLCHIEVPPAAFFKCQCYSSFIKMKQSQNYLTQVKVTTAAQNNVSWGLMPPGQAMRIPFGGSPGQLVCGTQGQVCEDTFLLGFNTK